MNSSRHKQITETFLGACDLGEEELQAFLDKNCGDDVELRSEVESLLKHHRLHTVSTRPVSDAKSAAPPRTPALHRISRNPLAATSTGERRRSLLAAGIVMLALAIVGFWVCRRVHSALQDDLQNQLQLVLDANVNALEHWVTEQQTELKSWARNQEVRELIIQLTEIDRPSQKQLLESTAREKLMSLLKPIIDEDEDRYVGVLRRDGICLTHTNDDLVGAEVAPDREFYLGRLRLGETVFAKPSKRAMYVVGFPVQSGDPVMAVATPVRDDNGQVVAALAFAYAADEEFTELLSTAHLGNTGETYAFDKDGILLSNVNDPEELSTLKLLEPQQGPLLNLRIADPGVDLTAGYQSKTRLPLRPLTMMAASAVAMENDVHLDGYRNYRGIWVIGAWRWLPEYEFAVGTEIEYGEAYAPLRYVINAFWVLFGVVAVLAVATTVSTAWILDLRKQVNQVRQLGQYTLEKLIGQGGMGQVYKARHALLRRPTAIKLLNGKQADSVTVARFEQEVQLTSQLTHPNTIQVYDYGAASEDTFYYAMEYLDGLNLMQLIQIERSLPLARAIHILRQTCGSLKEAHDLGLIHRDIKPANIMICCRGGMSDVVKLLDFGLAKSIRPESSAKLTQAHHIGGTPRYIAPERIAGVEEVNAQSDLYSLGAVAYFLITGQEIFPDASAAQIVCQTGTVDPPRPSEVTSIDIPRELDDLVARCLARRPNDRPPGVGAILQVLDKLAETEKWEPADADSWWHERWPLAQ